MRTINKMVIQPDTPNDNKVLWLNKNNASYYNNGTWVTIGESSEDMRELEEKVDSLDVDMQTVENEIQDINSRHNTLNTKHESLSRTVQGIAATGGASTATNVTYNNDDSGLNAENAQDAIDELSSIIIYDVSAHNNGAVFESLQALLSSSNLSTLIPISVRHGGMTIRFIQGSIPSSDNKYVQFRLIANTFTTDVTKWQGVEDKPSAHSKNLVESGGLYDILYDHYKAVKAPDSVGISYIDFNIDGTIIQYSKEIIFQITPNKTSTVQFRSSDGAISQKQVTSDSNGIVPLIVTNNTNALLSDLVVL